MSYLFLFNVCFVIISIIIADRKDRSGTAWGILTLFFGPLSLLILLALPKHIGGKRFIECPFCKQIIDKEAKRCSFCRAEFNNL
jgi:hypothetical protein